MIRAVLTAAVLMLLAACAPVTQLAGKPDVTFQGPRLEEHAFVSFDGARLGLSEWDPATGEPWAVVIGLHGMNDYANAFHLAGEQWAQDGITTIAYDQRGFGRSPARGVWGGQDLMAEDLRTITALARQRYPHAIIAVAGESMGAAVAIDAFSSDRPPARTGWSWSRQPCGAGPASPGPTARPCG